MQYFVLAHSVQNFRMNPAGYGDTFPPMTTGLICLPQLRFSQYKTRSMLQVVPEKYALSVNYTHLNNIYVFQL